MFSHPAGLLTCCRPQYPVSTVRPNATWGSANRQRRPGSTSSSHPSSAATSRQNLNILSGKKKLSWLRQLATRQRVGGHVTSPSHPLVVSVPSSSSTTMRVKLNCMSMAVCAWWWATGRAALSYTRRSNNSRRNTLIQLEWASAEIINHSFN